MSTDSAVPNGGIIPCKGQPVVSQDRLAELRRRIKERIARGDDGERPETMSWLERLGVHFDVSPAVVGALGLVMGALLATGMVVALQEGPLYRPDRPLAPLELSSMAPSPLGWPSDSPQPQPKPAPRPEAVPRSTEPVTTFESAQLPGGLPFTQPVNYRGVVTPR